MRDKSSRIFNVEWSNLWETLNQACGMNCKLLARSRSRLGPLRSTSGLAHDRELHCRILHNLDTWDLLREMD